MLRRLLLLCLVLLCFVVLVGCDVVRKLPDLVPTPPPPAEQPPVEKPEKPPGDKPAGFTHEPVCHSTPGLVTGCWHQPPGSDWQYIPPAPQPPASTPPIGATFPVRFPLQSARIYMNTAPYASPGTFYGTLLVEGDDALCKLLHGDAGHSPCHLDARVWGGSRPMQVAYEGYVYGGARDGLPLPKPLCPVWQFRSGGVIEQCHDNHDALASCDHFGTTDMRDDPQTPGVFEGEPKFCALQSDTFGPYAGFFAIAHGAAEVRACPPLDTAGPNCGPWNAFNK